MRAYSVDALVLRTYRYGEADRIVVFLTEDRGKKRGVAKNATASRRRFGGGARAADARAGDLRRARAPRARAARSHRAAARRRLRPRPAGRHDDAAHVLGHAAYFAELLDEWAPDGRAERAAVPAGRGGGRGAWRGRLDRRAGAVFRVLAAAARGRVSRARSLSALRAAGARRRGGAGAGRARVCLRRRARTADRSCRPTAMAFLCAHAGRGRRRDVGGARRAPAGASGTRAGARSVDRDAPREGTAVGARGEGVETDS